AGDCGPRSTPNRARGACGYPSTSTALQVLSSVPRADQGSGGRCRNPCHSRMAEWPRLFFASRSAKATIRLVGGVGRLDVGRLGSGLPSRLRSLICCREAFFPLHGRWLLGVAASVITACPPERLLRPTLERQRLVR